MITWDIETEKYHEGYNSICGVDEAGRGPLAGPVFAAAVILPYGLNIEGLNDSKVLSEKKREKLFDEIIAFSESYAIAMADVDEIEKYNILNASMLAMKRAVDSLTIKPDILLIDGNIARGFDIEAHPIIKGDAKSPSIAAASILAKVSRDRYCITMNEMYPQYGFVSHKGYGTKAHIAAIHEHGASPIHRKSFLKKIL